MSTSMPSLTRRRMLTIIAATGAASLLPWTGRAATAYEATEWRGYALGADARLLLHGRSRADAERAIAVSMAEIERLENEFSLYRANSSLCRLNRDGMLPRPSADMTALLRLGCRFGDLSHGAFDISVQPLWQLYAAHFALPNADPAGPSEDKIKETLARVDYRRIRIDDDAIRLAPGMALTLNGIAQGYITDRVADILRDQGWSHILVDLGETRALDSHPSGRPWRIGLKGGPSAAVAPTLDIADRAVATSARRGFIFDAAGRHCHLLDPASGHAAQGFASVTVVARRAADADALSTALSIMPPAQAASLAQRLKDSEIWVGADNGSIAHL